MFSSLLNLAQVVVDTVQEVNLKSGVTGFYSAQHLTGLAEELGLEEEIRRGRCEICGDQLSQESFGDNLGAIEKQGDVSHLFCENLKCRIVSDTVGA